MTPADLKVVLLAAGSLLLCAAVALRLPQAAVPLAAAMFGLEQLAAGELGLFQSEPAFFNQLTAALVLCCVAVRLLRGEQARVESREGRVALLLVYASAAFFWGSLAWSPFDDQVGNALQLAHFACFAVLLPLLVEPQRRMIGVWAGLGAVLAVGALALFARYPVWDVVAQQGRLSIRVSSTEELFANPLALADAFAYLVLIGAMLALRGAGGAGPRAAWGRAVRLGALAAAGAGAYVVFLTSRGELVVCVVCLVVMVTLVHAHGAGRTTAVALAVLLLALTVVQFLVFSSLYGAITDVAPRYSQLSLEQSVATRLDLAADALALLGASAGSALFGVGARGCEALLGFYPHSSVIQALVETGALGALLFLAANGAVLWLGLAAVRRARASGDREVTVYASFLFALLLYSVIIGNKKGGLAQHDSWMWLALSAYGFDGLLRSARPAPAPPGGRP